MKNYYKVSLTGLTFNQLHLSICISNPNLEMANMQVESENESYSILLQNAETVGLVSPLHGK